MTTRSNDQILLDDLISERQQNIGGDYTETEFFEVFCAEHILTDSDLSYEELEDGIVDGGNDGGIDSIYCFVNDELANEDTDFSVYRRHCIIRVVVIQSKVSRGFSERSVDALSATTRDLFNLSKSPDELSDRYNAKLLSHAQTIRRAIRELNTKFPYLHFDYYYVTKGEQPNGATVAKTEHIRLLVESLFSNCSFSFNFLGARGLRQLAAKMPSTSVTMTLAETPISTGRVGFLCLVKLSDYFSFITDESGLLRRQLFEWNVRDYQGSTEVNEGIQQTLANSSETADFWWLNNGVTVIALDASLSGKALSIEDPQIVNGLQTSMEIYRFLKSDPHETDDRAVLVRVIVPDDDASRDRIIKATNSQTHIPVASLRATDPLQRDIEAYFRGKGFFYDRRKNFHKNAGAPKDKVVTIPVLAQSIMAIILQKPDDSRARPSSLLKDDADYKRVFNPDYPINSYLNCALILRRIESFLKTYAVDLSSNDRNNIRFHLAMMATANVVGVRKPTALQVSRLALEQFDDDLLAGRSDIVVSTLEQLAMNTGLSNDQVAKSPEFVKALLLNLEATLPTTPVLSS